MSPLVSVRFWRVTLAPAMLRSGETLPPSILYLTDVPSIVKALSMLIYTFSVINRSLDKVIVPVKPIAKLIVSAPGLVVVLFAVSIASLNVITVASSA